MTIIMVVGGAFYLFTAGYMIGRYHNGGNTIRIQIPACEGGAGGPGIPNPIIEEHYR